MNDFIETLKRLYSHNELTKAKLNELLKEKKITEDAYKYIIAKKES